MKTIYDLNKVFRYRQDGKLDRWMILEPDSNGIVRGDCEDYALTALYLICNKSLFRFWLKLIFGRVKIRYGEINGRGHAVLEYEGRYIDNITKRWGGVSDICKSGFKFKSWNYIWFTVAIKMLFAKLTRGRNAK